MIKSLNIVHPIDSNNPNGLNSINKDQLSNITNNYVEHIDCVDLDKFEIAERHKILSDAIQKLAINGTMNLKFINLDLVANKIEKNELTGQQYSKLLPDIRSCWSHLECMDIIAQSKMQIKNMYYDNIYTIVKLEKSQ